MSNTSSKCLLGNQGQSKIYLREGVAEGEGTTGPGGVGVGIIGVGEGTTGPGGDGVGIIGVGVGVGVEQLP